jgi:1,4-dihydroxy-2-naphthoate polyprenyltransferase
MLEPRAPSKLSTAIRAARPLAHANIAPALLLGQALAFRVDGRFSLGALAYVHLFGIVDHLFIVFANDYADRHADSAARTLVSGGSGVLVEGRVRPSTLRVAAFAAGVTLILLGIAHGTIMLAFALAAIALILAYSFSPLRLSYRGHGEWLQGLGVGLVLPWVGFYAQSGSLSAPFECFLGPIVLATASNVVTAMPDLECDARATKRTLPVRLGAVRAARVAMAGTLVGVLLTVSLVPIDYEWRALVLVLAIAPLAVSSRRWPSNAGASVMPWVVGMGASHQLTLVGVVLALFLAR